MTIRGPNSESIVHVGQYVRDNVIPSGTTVTEAASLLGIGRPALSNFLNGKAKLSSRMALRLENAFGADSEFLLDMQSRIELQAAGSARGSVVTGTYAPSILTIRAKQIEGWATGIEARSRLAVLTRRLVYSTGSGITRADFPGYDNAERHGFDGVVESTGQTQWVPGGKSIWELGTGKGLEGKANRDYRDSLTSMPPEERAECSFIFVTSRNWPGKVKWESDRKKLGDWGDVRSYDASDLEQWTEQSVPAQVWLAEELEIPVTGYLTLDECWRGWSEVTEPTLSRSIFAPMLEVHAAKLEVWLGSHASDPIVIAADSTDEALAFLSCLVEDDRSKNESWGNRTVVFDTQESLKRLARSLPPSIVCVSSNMDVERELATLRRGAHCIFVRPRGLLDSEPDITLDRLSLDDFRTALTEMNISRDRTDRLDRESGRSPTILRRRLSKPDIIRVPSWAREEDTARKLAPLALVGSWHCDSRADQEVVGTLARTDSYETIESSIISLLHKEDAPVWSTGEYRGVVSKLDSLFAIGRHVTEQQLNDFFLIAEYVLSEFDPALELPPDQQWAANIYEKVREHSSALRAGICETLVVLGAHGSDILRRPELEVESRVNRLVRDLLGSPDADKLLSLHSDLPNLAEAAPVAFLDMIERDLRSRDPVVFQLFSPDVDVMFGVLRHTGLLWALERLAWDPENLIRVAKILAELCPARLPSNLANRPLNTLKAILRFWIPQTAATVDQRIKVLEVLTSNYPEVGWDVCIDQVGRSSIGKYNERPRWRSDASGVGQQIVGQSEMEQFRNSAVCLALGWSGHNENTLGALVDAVDRLSGVEQNSLWDAIDEWSRETVSEGEKAALWKRLRMTRPDTIYDQLRIRKVIQGLTPTDPVMRNEWMFSWDWLNYPEVRKQDLADFEASERLMQDRRMDALREIWKARGFEGISVLIERSEEASHFVGRLMSRVLTDVEAFASFVQDCVQESSGDDMSRHAHLLRAFLQSCDPTSFRDIFMGVETALEQDDLRFLFLCMPYGSSTWRLLDAQPDVFREDYWKRVYPSGLNYKSAEINESIDRLLDVGRPRVAFSAVQFNWNRVETSRLKHLLQDIASVESEGFIDEFHLSSAFEALDERPETSTFEKARLEFSHIPGLVQSRHGIPNIERLVAESPETFVELIAAVYRAESDTQSPDDQQPDTAIRQAQGEAAYLALGKIARVPGMGADGSIDLERLKAWIARVRELSAEQDLTGPCDSRIGELLSRASPDEDGSWPSRPVCEAMERVASESAASGFVIGVSNSRGAFVRGRGGDQERELAEEYHACASRIAFDYPFMSSMLKKLAQQYEREATWWDTRAEVGARLEN